MNRIKSDPGARFRGAFKARRATVHDHQDGMGSLSVGNSIDQVQLADHRLTLAGRPDLHQQPRTGLST